MSNRIPAHACIRTAISGTVMSAIRICPIGEVCPVCGVLITEKYAIWPENNPTESTREDIEIYTLKCNKCVKSIDICDCR